MQIVLASRNAHKIEELRRMAPQVTWVAMPDTLPDPPETGDTFEDNAVEKARFVAHATGLMALADDSGLEVDALGGAPGVYSRRYSPEATDAANNAKLLAELEGLARDAGDRGERPPLRTARYRCVLAVVHGDTVRTVSGVCEGRIGWEPRGDGGFGYDPLFWPDEVPGRAMAELSPAEKDAVSHRGAAVAQLDALLAGLV
jgi:XTP/dITP diphosphohydrolase